MRLPPGSSPHANRRSAIVHDGWSRLLIDTQRVRMAISVQFGLAVHIRASRSVGPVEAAALVAAEGHLRAVPFSYAQQFVRRPDSARVENSHTRRGFLPLSGAAPTSSYPSPGIPARRVAPLPGLAQPGAGPSISTSGQAWPEVGLRALPSPGRVREAMAPTSAMPAPATIAR